MAANTQSAPQAGDSAPDVNLITDSGEAFRLSSLKGKHVVLYFYPKADTPGCTTEACEFRDGWSEIQRLGAVVIGVSPDTPARQAKFKAKFSLPFPLLADVDNQAAAAYGVWVEKSMYGKKYMGVERATFVIGKDGKVAEVFRKVKPAGHAAEVLDALKRLG